MSWWDDLRNVKREHWFETGYWAFYALLGSFSPLIGTLVLIMVLNTTQDVSLWSHGEFYIYTVSLLCPTIYTLKSEQNVRLFFVIALIAVVVALVLFAGLRVAEFVGAEDSISEFENKWTSFVLIAIAIVVMIATKLVETVRHLSPTGLTKDREDRVDKLALGYRNAGEINE